MEIKGELKEIQLARISVGMEKTKQVIQFEPVKVSVHVSESAENITPEKIREMIRTVETEIDIKMGSLEARKR